MSSSVMKRTAAGLIFTGVVVISLAYLSYHNASEFMSAGEMVSHTHDVLEGVQALKVDVIRAESGTRGFIISESPRSLLAVQGASRRISISLAMLQQLTGDNPAQRQRLEAAQRLIAERQKILAHMVNLDRSDGLKTVRAFITSHDSEATMQQLSRTLSEIERSEEKLLAERKSSLEIKTRNTNIILFLAVAVEIILLVLVYASFRIYVQERRRNFHIMAMQKEELEVRNQAVERANRLKSQFLASMSHELRTPMNAILGFSELLEADTSVQFDAKQKRWLLHIRNAGQHLLQLINDMLDISKIEAGRMEIRREDFSINDVLPEVLSIVTPAAIAKKISLSTDVPENMVISADRVRFKQVVYNLLSNAVKFTPESGSVRLECQPQESTAIISVIDNGIGIRQEDQATIFDEFRQIGTTAAGVKEGTGLGLAISRRLVQLHGGSMWVDSEKGKGSRFTFTMPLGQHVSAPIERPRAVAERSPSDRSRPLVLVVDDEPATQEMLKNFLQDKYDVLTASSSWEALALAQLHKPDAITLDILMPGGSGWEVLHQLKSTGETANLPIIVVSIVDRKELGFILGASDYLVKPISRDTLVSTIQRHIGSLSGGAPILVVDDDPDDLNIMVEAVETAGYFPVPARNGMEAMRFVERVRPRAVILDLVMPDVDGFETLRRLRLMPEFETLPVLVLTARDLSQAETELLLRSANSCFRKGPGWKQELLERIRTAIEAEHHNPVDAS